MAEEQPPFTGFSARSGRSTTPSEAPETPTHSRLQAAFQAVTISDTDPETPTAGTTEVVAPIPRHSPTNPFEQPPLPSTTGEFRLPRSAQQSSAPGVTTAERPTMERPKSTGHSDTTPDLAAALALLAGSLQRSSSRNSSERSNVREPDQYDGSDPQKLRAFFTQLELVFKARPKTFDTEEKRVTYAISFLKGTPLQWFEPYLLEIDSDSPPDFMSDYRVFQEELRINFGPYDVTGSAEHELENLHMTDNHKIAKYITQFARLATQTRWGQEALRYQFYRGLPDRIKDRISEVGKPTNLHALRTLAQQIDHRYWERKTERSREGGNSGNKPKSDKPADNKSASTGSSDNKSQAKASGSKSDNSASRSNQGQQKNDKPPKPYADKLGKDGKLTPEERQRRFTNNLCLFCGKAGHSAKDCRQKNSSAAKARAAQVQADAEAPAAEPKN